MTEVTTSVWEPHVDAGRRRLLQGDAAGADASFAAAIAAAETLGNDSAGLAACLTVLGQVRAQQRDTAAAEQLFRRALDVRERAAEFDHTGIIQVLGHLATVHNARADYEEAEALLLRALTLADRFLPAGHAAVASLLNNLARLYFKRADHAKADRMLVRLLQIKQALGTEHPEVAGVLASIAALRSALGKHDVAEQLWRRVLAIREQSLPANDPALITTLNSLADALAAQGDQEEAVHFRERGLRLQAQSPGPDRPDGATAPRTSTGPHDGLTGETPSGDVPVVAHAGAAKPADSVVTVSRLTPAEAVVPPRTPTPIQVAAPPRVIETAATVAPPARQATPPVSAAQPSPEQAAQVLSGIQQRRITPIPLAPILPVAPAASRTVEPFSPGTSSSFAPSPGGGFTPDTSGGFTPFAPPPPPAIVAGIGGPPAPLQRPPGRPEISGGVEAPPLPPPSPAPRVVPRDPAPPPAPPRRQSEPSVERPRYQGYDVPAPPKSHRGKLVGALAVAAGVAIASVVMGRQEAAEATAASVADSARVEPRVIRVPAESLRPSRSRDQGSVSAGLPLDSALALTRDHAALDSTAAPDTVQRPIVVPSPARLEALSRAVDAGIKARVDSAVRAPEFNTPFKQRP